MTLLGLGGKARKTGTCLLFFEDGKAKACLNDRETGHYCFYSAETVDSVWEGLDKGLRAGTLDWRVSKGFKR